MVPPFGNEKPNIFADAGHEVALVGVIGDVEGGVVLLGEESEELKKDLETRGDCGNRLVTTELG